MSFMVPQDHKAADRDTTLSTPSSTRWEDPAATTRRRSHCLLSLAVVSVLVLLVVNYIVVELVLLVLEDPHPGRQPKQIVVKKIKLLYSSINRRI
jgi:hypothetical protein